MKNFLIIKGALVLSVLAPCVVKAEASWIKIQLNGVKSSIGGAFTTVHKALSTVKLPLLVGSQTAKIVGIVTLVGLATYVMYKLTAIKKQQNNRDVGTYTLRYRGPMVK